MRRECGLRLYRVQFAVRFWGEIPLLAGNLQRILVTWSLAISSFGEHADLHPKHSLLHHPFKRDALAQNMVRCHVRRQGAIANGDLDFRRKEGELIPFADEAASTVLIGGDGLQRGAVFERLRPMK